MQETHGVRKFFKGLCVFLFVIILVAFVALLSFLLVFKKGNDSPCVFGYRITLMNNDSMGDAIPSGSLMFSKAVTTPTQNSIVIFKNVPGNTYTACRYMSTVSYDDISSYLLKADNSDSGFLISASTPLENVFYASHKLGVAVSFITSYKGVLVCAIVPCALLILLEIILALRSKKQVDVDTAGEKVEEEKPQVVKVSDVPELNVSKKTQAPLNVLIEEKERHDLENLKTTEDTTLSADDARAIFAERHKSEKDKAQKLADDILDEVK